MTKYVLFDLDGTLNDPYEGITSCIKYALQSVGLDENDPIKLRSYIGPPLRNTFSLYGFEGDECEKLVDKYREEFHRTGIHQNVTYEGVHEMLKALHEHGCKIALASCKPEGACKIILEETKMLCYFDEVVGATLDKTLDTKPAIIKEALRRLGAQKEDFEHAYMVGDRDMDMIGALENGIKAVGAVFGYGGAEELLDSGAQYLINSPTELVDIVIKED